VAGRGGTGRLQVEGEGVSGGKGHLAR
jgi:hypothetical protein